MHATRRVRQRREKHTALIDSLAAALFPHQESEDEQEAFTPEGRKRVDRWIEHTLLRHSRPCAVPAFTDCQWD